MGALDRIRQKARRDKIPLTAHFDLTYRCHQRCLHCYLPESWRRGKGPGPELNTVQVTRILDQLAEAGTFFLTFSGGEIFLRPDLFSILKHACSLKFCVSLMTSGSMNLEKEKVRALREMGVSRLRVSLYSLDAATHDRVTGMPGSWARMMGFVEESRAQGIFLAFNSIALKINYRQVPEMRAFASREKIPYLMDDNLVARWDGQPHLPGLQLEPEEKSFYELPPGDEQLSGSAITPLEAEELPGCGAGSNSGYISPQGELWPCIDIPWPCARLDSNGNFLALWQNAGVLKSVRELQTQSIFHDERLCDYLRRDEIMAMHFPLNQRKKARASR